MYIISFYNTIGRNFLQNISQMYRYDYDTKYINNSVRYTCVRELLSASPNIVWFSCTELIAFGECTLAIIFLMHYILQ